MAQAKTLTKEELTRVLDYIRTLMATQTPPPLATSNSPT